MATINEVPLSPKAQRFLITLAGITWQLRVRWSPASACWVLDIADAAGVPVLSGVPMVTGADLLAQYAYLGIGGALYVQSDDSVDAVPTFANLGSIGHLYFVTP